MEQHGFIHTMLDVKVLILYLMGQVQYPVDTQTIFALAYQDECVNYFDVAQALPQMVDSGHLSRSENGEYTITEKGIETGKVTDSSLAFPVMQRVKAAVERFNRTRRRGDYVHVRLVDRPDGQCSVIMGLDDPLGNLMTLEMSAPSRKQARTLENAFTERAEQIYQMLIAALLDDETEDDDA